MLGKGDAMWRALGVLTGDVICFLDADTDHFGPHFACGLLGPLLCLAGNLIRQGLTIGVLSGSGEVTLPDGGGRVTALTARPLLNLFYPELAAVEQPLAGEVAARRDLLERLPFVTGYGVDIGLLLDAHREAGLDALAQVDLDVRQNAHQSLEELAPMAFAVLRALATRLERDGRLTGALPSTFLLPGRDELRVLSGEDVERPPLVKLRAAA